MMQQIPPGQLSATPPASMILTDSSTSAVEAPSKLVATAMESLSRAARLIADIRIGADSLLEALFLAAESPHQSNKAIQLVVKEESAMGQYFQDLRDLGKQLEDSGVLNGSLKSQGNSWSLHMPLVCPDGAVVAYAWKRQLAGQAGASAVDRSRLALKAFTDQKRRFFPHLEDEEFGQHIDGGLVTAKRLCGSQGLITGHRDLLSKERSVLDIINNLQLVTPDIRIFTYQRLDWLKRASALSSNHIGESSNEHSYQNTKGLRSVLGNTVIAVDHIAVIELLVHSVFRAVVSVHPAGSMNPEELAFFSTDEGGNYVHLRGLSVFHVFKHITEHAKKALQYFQSVDMDTSLSLLLHWICSYKSLFTDTCSKCRRLLMMDKSLAFILPPVHRTYLITSATKSYVNQLSSSDKSQSCDYVFAYHVGCSADDT